MVKLTDLAKRIEDGLREEAGDALNTADGKYEFRIVTDTTDYQKASRFGNEVTHYIHGLVVQTGSNIESMNGDEMHSSASISGRLELLVPVLDGSDDDGNKQLVTTVRSILDSYFSKNGVTVEEEYTIGYSYSVAASGIRDIVPPVGDCFVFIVTLDWYILANGINSTHIKASIKIGDVYEVIPYRTFGMMRQAVQDTFTPSDGSVGKNVTVSSVFTINFGLETMYGSIGEVINDYLMTGVSPVYDIKIEVPYSVNKSKIVYYRMRFNDASLNAQIPLNASSTFKMTEVL
jgi:hypothetical protein